MQWTVRYFRYMSLKWAVPSAPTSGTGTGNVPITAGAIAYWNRKRAVWEDMMKKTDGIFSTTNPAYVSPL